MVLMGLMNPRDEQSGRGGVLSFIPVWAEQWHESIGVSTESDNLRL
jgi:hypothetical protein